MWLLMQLALHLNTKLQPPCVSCNTQDGTFCRYYGVNDPVARKMLNRVDTMPKLIPPEDASITTLYVGGLIFFQAEDGIRDQFYSYGELQSVKKVLQLLANTVFLHFSPHLVFGAGMCAEGTLFVMAGHI